MHNSLRRLGGMPRFKSLLILLVLTTFALAQGSLPYPKGGTTIYVVKPGDTLSGISKKFFGNAFYWPRLWEINPYIDNPHLIFPGETVKLTDLQVVKFDPQTRVEELKNIIPPPPVYYYSWAQSEGFIVPGSWEHMGSIISSEPSKILLGEGDNVYLNVGSNFGIRPGDMLTVFRDTAPVRHPVTGKLVGFKVAILGDVEVLRILNKNQSYGVITQSYREITRGASIRPLEPFVKEVVIRKGKKHTEGFVLESKSNIFLNGVGNVVYIDVGRDDNVIPGYTFSIFQYPRNAFDIDRGETVTIPGVKIGELVVLRVGENTSTAVITQSSRQIEPGNVVVLNL